MGGTCTNGATVFEQRFRWVFEYCVRGDLRFISHRDTLRLFQRALVRAELPVRWSEGFNPHPCIMIPLPRPVGVASEAEAIVIETDSPIDPDDALQRLECQTPSDLQMTRGRRLQPGERMEPVLARYRVEPTDPSVTDLRDRVRRLLEADTVQVERTNPKKAKTVSVDIRPYIADVRLDGDAVEFSLRVTCDGTAKPAEIAHLLGYRADRINHRIRRLEIQWQ